ncbi:GD22964 [Drosophila simulans]|uniref:GD22964 n=1 Tax=Drosophila simulans TaxID=7240 RepID=B4Q628_DROSI|nr:GD22964 [Drosophila simulans]
MMRTRAAEHRGSKRSLAGQSFQELSVCQEPDPLNTYLEKPLALYQWMRWRNCKTHKPHLEETYPSILPPISKCDNAKTLKYVEDAMEANKCKEYVKEDVLTVWNHSPQKESLVWYGVKSQYPSPQAVLYDRALKKSLKAASLAPKPPKKSNIKPKWQLQKKPPQPGAFVLNRRCLKAKLDRMPNIKRQLKSNNVFTWLHCPQPADPSNPFEDSAVYPAISIEQAMDMAKPEKPPKHGLRRKHWYCPPKCGEAESKCTDYEWAKYKMDPRPYNEAFQREIANQKALKQPEPRNYDELYKSLVTCFVQDPNGKNDLCEALEKCCRDPKDPPAQGCSEFVPDGAGGDEVCGCCGKCCCSRKKGGESCEVKPIMTTTVNSTKNAPSQLALTLLTNPQNQLPKERLKSKNQVYAPLVALRTVLCERRVWWLYQGYPARCSGRPSRGRSPWHRRAL